MNQQTVKPSLEQPALAHGNAFRRGSISRSTLLWFTVLLMIGLIRAAMLYANFDQLSEDPDAYQAIATTLARTGRFAMAPTDMAAAPTAYRPPLYPLVLHAASFVKLPAPWTVAILHWLLGVTTAMMMVPLAEAVGLVRWRWLPAILVAVDPILLNQSSLIMTETLATFLAVVILYMLLRLSQEPNMPRLFTVGLLFGLAILCRPTFLAWWALCCAGWLITPNAKFGRGKLAHRVAQLMVVVAGTLTLLTPWMVRNQWVLYPNGERSLLSSRPVWTTTHGGYTLYLGNNDDYYDWLTAGGIANAKSPRRNIAWEASAPEFQRELGLLREQAMHLRDDRSQHAGPAIQVGKNMRWDSEAGHLEPIIDQLYYEAAWHTMGARPGACVAACLKRVGNLWTPLPRQVDLRESTSTMAIRYSIAAWYIFLYGGVAVACTSNRRLLFRTPVSWGVLFCVGLTLVHTLYWSNMRMRAPVMPVIALLAAAGWIHLCKTIRHRRAFESRQVESWVS